MPTTALAVISTLLVSVISIQLIFDDAKLHTNQGISQVLIVTRVNISKFSTVGDLAKTITAVSGEWDNPAASTSAVYDGINTHFSIYCPQCGRDCDCQH
jgi:hypothetical protein